jgi:hypothetical protein
VHLQIQRYFNGHDLLTGTGTPMTNNNDTRKATCGLLDQGSATGITQLPTLNIFQSTYSATTQNDADCEEEEEDEDDGYGFEGGDFLVGWGAEESDEESSGEAGG